MLNFQVFLLRSCARTHLFTDSLVLSSSVGVKAQRMQGKNWQKLNWRDSWWELKGGGVNEALSGDSYWQVILFEPSLHPCSKWKQASNLSFPLTCLTLFTLPCWFSETLSHPTHVPSLSCFQQFFYTIGLYQLTLQTFLKISWRFTNPKQSDSDLCTMAYPVSLVNSHKSIPNSDQYEFAL